MSEWPGNAQQRAARRAWAIGVAVWPAVRKRPDRWLQRLRAATPMRDRWIWHPDRLQDSGPDSIRAKVFGQVVLSEWGARRELGVWGSWMRMAAQVDDSRESWLWCADCLVADGWQRKTVTVKLKSGAKEEREGWCKAPLEE